MDEEYENNFTDIHSEQTIIEMVDQPNVDVHYDINAECAVASLMGSPCASSVHYSAVVVAPADVNITVDMQPVGDSVVDATMILALAMVFIVVALKKIK